MVCESRRVITCQWCCGLIYDELEYGEFPTRAIIYGMALDYLLLPRPAKTRYEVSGFTFCPLDIFRFSRFVAGVATYDLNSGLPKADEPLRQRILIVIRFHWLA
jgi:hypothetical protein